MTRKSQARIAYGAYASCALLVALFGWQLVATGLEVYMLSGLLLFPLAGAAMVAIGFSWGVHSKILRVLGALSVAVCLFLFFDGNTALAIQLVLVSGYVMSVLAGCVLGWREW